MTNARNSNYSTIIIGVLFFIFGFITWVNGTLIPYLKIACELTDSQSYFVAFAFYISYFFTAIPCSWILQRTGFKKGMMLGLLCMAAGALIFIPAANSRTYSIFLLGLFVIGTVPISALKSLLCASFHLTSLHKSTYLKHCRFGWYLKVFCLKW